MNISKNVLIKGGLVALLVVGVAGWKLSSAGKDVPAAQPPAAAKPALTVVTVTLQPAQWTQTLSANGSVLAWQEAVIGAEVSGVRIADVRVSVGDTVSRGQVLATLATDTLQAADSETLAAVKENEALLADASANAARSRKLAEAGFISAQQLQQVQTQEQTARARLEVQRAKHQSSALRLAQGSITAPDSGVISARTATVGTLTQPGAELFRLIRQGRLEWHAELTAEELLQIRPGIKVELASAQGRTVEGVVRAVAPAVNPQTRYGQVLVELPRDCGLLAGMFVRGEFQLSQQDKPLWSLPQSALVMRSGAAYVLTVDGASRVRERKVTVGQRHDDRVEITGGLERDTPVVASGSAFLVDGDVVRVAPAAKPAAGVPAK
ncbi:MAG: efflux RND transporter periplasmic adaptor subunit [Gallionella sp.]|nr:efflux RND transporter periplasmic adaptor subunit [Gallionella sp.]MDD4945825.1 efflux RND transporter periplasmic adaptor subunit [Gallionella sp.]MDD5613242.1 efflux RND transporter periplasmic adaptor subunit [Gallionella sp.]